MSALIPSPSARTPKPLLVLLGRGLEGALNRVVDLDPESRARIAALDGRALTLDIRHTGLAARIAVVGERLTVGPAFEGDSALRVAATPGGLLALALARRRDGAFPPGAVEIAGDAELARRLEQIASRFAPDFDEVFARVFGDVAGYRIARAVRAALAWSAQAAKSLARDTAEYLTEEGRDVVSKSELDGFLDDVDALRERADRLDARVRRIAAHAKTRT